MRISDWSSDVCSSDLGAARVRSYRLPTAAIRYRSREHVCGGSLWKRRFPEQRMWHGRGGDALSDRAGRPGRGDRCVVLGRSLLSYGPALRRGRRPEEHMGGPQGRTHSQLLSNGEIARDQTADGFTIHGDMEEEEGSVG